MRQVRDISSSIPAWKSAIALLPKPLDRGVLAGVHKAPYPLTDAQFWAENGQDLFAWV